MEPVDSFVAERTSVSFPINNVIKLYNEYLVLQKLTVICGEVGSLSITWFESDITPPWKNGRQMYYWTLDVFYTMADKHRASLIFSSGCI